jgi:predicted RNase H-like nuclease (RuvC/YqgF family)
MGVLKFSAVLLTTAAVVCALTSFTAPNVHAEDANSSAKQHSMSDELLNTGEVVYQGEAADGANAVVVVEPNVVKKAVQKKTSDRVQAETARAAMAAGTTASKTMAGSTTGSMVDDMQNQNQQLARALELTRSELGVLKDKYQTLDKRYQVVSEQNERLHIDLKQNADGEEALYSAEYQKKLSQRVLNLTTKAATLEARNKALQASINKQGHTMKMETSPDVLSASANGEGNIKALQDQNSLLSSRNRELSSMVLMLKDDLAKAQGGIPNAKAPPVSLKSEDQSNVTAELAAKDKEISNLVARSSALQDRLMKITEERDQAKAAAMRAQPGQSSMEAKSMQVSDNMDVAGLKQRDAMLTNKVRQLEEENQIMRNDIKDMAERLDKSSQSCDERWLSNSGQTNQVMEMSERLTSLESENTRLRANCSK